MELASRGDRFNVDNTLLGDTAPAPPPDGENDKYSHFRGLPNIRIFPFGKAEDIDGDLGESHPDAI